MKIEGAIEKFALSIAIGSLVMFGVFLIASATVNGFIEEFEQTVQLTAWSAVAAIPAVTMAYIVGAFTQVLADQVIDFASARAQEDEWAALEHVARAQSDVLAAHFEEVRGAKKLLEGSLAPLVLIAIGLLLQRGQLPDLSTFLGYASVGLFALAVTVPFITGRLQKSLVKTGNIARDLNSPKTTALVDAHSGSLPADGAATG